MSEHLDPLFLSFQEAVAGRYSLQRELGRGGMGVVYLAREVRLDRLVAIKLLPPDLAAQTVLRDRFMREASTAARLSHPYVVPIHAVDEIGGFVFIVMAYVDGETLAQRVTQRGPLPPDEVTRLLREVAWALAYAHAQGVIHRDVKPANILLERGTQRALIADFGIARLTHTSGETAVGQVMGTPEFMSPEQASAEPLDGRSDLYSLGVVGYFALTGTLPFTAPSAQAVLAQHLTKPAPSAGTIARGAPRALVQAIDRCLEKEPTARFATGEALADALAPALAKRAEVPVPIRVFLDHRRYVPLIMPAAFVLPFMGRIAAALGSSWGAFALLGGLAVGLPVGVVIQRLRALMHLGYGHDDIVAGMRARFERQREEFLFEFGSTRSKRETVLTVTGVVAMVLGGSSVLAMLTLPGSSAPIFNTGIPTTLLLPMAFGASYGGLLMTIVSTKWRRLRQGSGSTLMRIAEGKLGRGLARLAAFRLGQRAIPADRPTELAIAMTAEGVYKELPKTMRRTLGDVPEVLRGLEAHARGARARVEELDAAIAEAEGGSGRAAERQGALVRDLREARSAAEARLAMAVSALESLRLDLLRLRAGAGSVEGMTADLAAAREIGESADRLVLSGQEIEAMLADTPA